MGDYPTSWLRVATVVEDSEAVNNRYEIYLGTHLILGSIVPTLSVFEPYLIFRRQVNLERECTYPVGRFKLLPISMSTGKYTSKR